MFIEFAPAVYEDSCLQPVDVWEGGGGGGDDL